MPIRAELRPLYPPHWRELSRRVRFERAGGRCQGCGRPHLARLRCLPDGRWFDEAAQTWRDRRGRPARWPDLVEAMRLRTTRVVLAAAHLDSDPATTGSPTCGRSASAATCCTIGRITWRSATSPIGGATHSVTCSWETMRKRRAIPPAYDPPREIRLPF